MSKEGEARRVICLVDIIKTYIASKEQGSIVPQNVVEFGESIYRIRRVVVEHKGGINYLVNDVISVKAFRDGTYGIWDFRVDSGGNLIK